MDYRKIAKRQQTLSTVMQDNVKTTIDDIISQNNGIFTLKDFDYITLEEEKVLVCEIEGNRFFFAGTVLKNEIDEMYKCFKKAIETGEYEYKTKNGEITFADFRQDYLQSNQFITYQIEKVKSKKTGKIYTNYTYVEQV